MWMKKDRKNPPRYSHQYSPRYPPWYSPRYSPGYSPPGWAARSGPSHSTPFCAPMESREPGIQDHTISKWPQNRVGVVTPTPHVGAKSGVSFYSSRTGPNVEWEWSLPLRMWVQRRVGVVSPIPNWSQNRVGMVTPTSKRHQNQVGMATRTSHVGPKSSGSGHDSFVVIIYSRIHEFKVFKPNRPN